MPSPIENKVRARLPITRLFAAYLPLSLARRLIKLGIKHVKLPAGITRESVSADGVPCEWLIPQDRSADRVLLYLHGGGFIYGLTPPHFQMVSSLAQKMGLRTLMVDYRVAPEHPFPAALDDCVIAYRWLLKQGISPENIVVAGDSAGGNLTITTLMKLHENGDQLPAAAACLSPVANLAERDKPPKLREDPLLHPRARKMFNKSYVAHNDPRDPLISPVFGDWHGLPPLLVHAGEDEILLDDAVSIQALAKAAGVDVRLEIYPRMWHVWQLYPQLPQAGQSLDDIAQFFTSHLG